MRYLFGPCKGKHRCLRQAATQQVCQRHDRASCCNGDTAGGCSSAVRRGGRSHRPRLGDKAASSTRCREAGEVMEVTTHLCPGCCVRNERLPRAKSCWRLKRRGAGRRWPDSRASGQQRRRCCRVLHAPLLSFFSRRLCQAQAPLAPGGCFACPSRGRPPRPPGRSRLECAFQS